MATQPRDDTRRFVARLRRYGFPVFSVERTAEVHRVLVAVPQTPRDLDTLQRAASGTAWATQDVEFVDAPEGRVALVTAAPREDAMSAGMHGRGGLPERGGYGARVFSDDLGNRDDLGDLDTWTTDDKADARTAQVQVVVLSGVRAAVERGDLDARTARRVLAGFEVAGAQVRATTPPAVGFVPVLLPFLARIGAEVVVADRVRASLERPAVEDAADEAGALRRVGVSARESSPSAPVGVDDPGVVAIEAFRGGFLDLIDTDGFRARL